MTHRQSLRIFKEIHQQFTSSDEIAAEELASIPDSSAADESETDTPDGDDHRTILINVLRDLSANGFERLCQRLLRESGFERVTVIGRSGDGGIDGIGILQVNPFVSFKVLFQCKKIFWCRYFVASKRLSWGNDGES